jgi:hypothetical protein
MYKGVTYRSRFEADVACFLDNIGYKWHYEPKPSKLLDNGVHYWPDFWVPELRLWVEPRGYRDDKGERQIEGFRKWVAESRAGPEMLEPTWPVIDRSEGIPKGVIKHVLERDQIADKAAWYLVIRPNGQPELYTNLQKEPLPVAFTFCKEGCQRWTLWTFTPPGLSPFIPCRHCQTAIDPSDDLLLVSLEGREGYLTVIDPLGSSLARDWATSWRKRLSLLEDKRVVRCKNYPSCRRSLAIDDSEELPLGWIKFEEHIKPSSEKEPSRVEKKYYCSGECFLRSYRYYVDEPDGDLNIYQMTRREPEATPTAEEGAKAHCGRQGLSCQEVWVSGGATTNIVVRSPFSKAPHLVIVHAFPLYRCERCGQESFHGSDRTAVTRALERSLVKGRPLPAEIEFDVALMADTLNEAGFVQGTPVPIVAAKGKRGRHDVLGFDLRLEKMRERQSGSCNQAEKICIDELIEGGTTVILPVKSQYVSVYGVPTYRCKVCGRESYPVESLGEVTRTLQKTKGELPTEVHFDSIGSFSQPI